MIDIQKLLDFTRFLEEFRKIERIVYAIGQNRLENDVEHSYQLTMTAWYISDAFHLDLDRNRLIRYCLVHDLVEVYAGDTYIYTKDAQHLESKDQREKEAVETIKKKFTDFPEMISCIEGYERKDTRESLFIYSLDKILPVVNIYLDNGRTWKDVNISEIIVTIEKLKEHKDSKIKKFPELYETWERLIEILKKEDGQLFIKQ